MDFFNSVTLDEKNYAEYKRLTGEEGYTVGITGHSLGGACAQFLALQLVNYGYVNDQVKVHTETFNAPGILDVVNGMSIRCGNIDSLEIINHLRYSDYVSKALAVSKHLGECRYYAYRNSARHAIIEFEQDLRDDTMSVFYSTREKAEAVAAYELERTKKTREDNPPPKSIQITM